MLNKIKLAIALAIAVLSVLPASVRHLVCVHKLFQL